MSGSRKHGHHAEFTVQSINQQESLRACSKGSGSHGRSWTRWLPYGKGCLSYGDCGLGTRTAGGESQLEDSARDKGPLTAQPRQLTVDVSGLKNRQNNQTGVNWNIGAWTSERRSGIQTIMSWEWGSQCKHLGIRRSEPRAALPGRWTRGLGNVRAIWKVWIL